MCAYSVIPPDRVYYITITVIDWIDIFTRDDYKKVIVESLEFCARNKGLNIHAYVLMTNHLHLIVSHEFGKDEISKIIGDFKKFTSREVVKLIIHNDLESRKSWILHRLSEEKVLQKSGCKLLNIKERWRTLSFMAARI